MDSTSCYLMENVKILSFYEYNSQNHLYIVSTKFDEENRICRTSSEYIVIHVNGLKGLKGLKGLYHLNCFKGLSSAKSAGPVVKL